MVASVTTVVGKRQQEKARTRVRISEHATGLFLARGFDTVTVADVAAAAGVSKVTVFAHFPRKEDLLLDLAPEAAELLRSAVLDRADGVGAIAALRSLAERLAAARHPLSGLTAGNETFVRTVAASPALIGRAWELLGELEVELADALASGSHPCPNPRLLAALVISAYRTVVTATIASRLDGEPATGELAEHRARLVQAFDALQLASDRLG